MLRSLSLLAALVLSSSLPSHAQTLKRAMADMTYIDGTQGNGEYLYVTASPRLYSIGNQFGQFPPTGWHLKGEMGGVWMQPLKLADGFSFKINDKPLYRADSFRSYPLASQFNYTIAGLQITRTDFATDNKPLLVTELVITNPSAHAVKVSLETEIHFNLMPVWLSERSGIVDGKDVIVRKEDQSVIISDDHNPWFAAAVLEGMKATVTDRGTKGNKHDCAYQGKIVVPAHGSKTVRLFLSGSLSDDDEALRNASISSTDLLTAFQAKADRYKAIDHTARINIPDVRLMRAYQWGKYCTDWLSRDVPGMGRGLSAGLPDYPWFFSNDQASTFTATVGTMSPEMMKESVLMIMERSDSVNDHAGRIFHEMSTNGQIYDKGRMEESQGLLHAAWTIYKWYGDREFLQRIYEQGLRIDKFLSDHDTDDDLYVEGYGGVEIEGLNQEMLDVACNTVLFYDDMEDMAREMGNDTLAQHYHSRAYMLRKKINHDWWDPEENRYFDMLCDSATALKLIDKALEERVVEGRNLWAKKKLQQLSSDIRSGRYHKNGYTVFYNPCTIALTTHTADVDKARAYLKTVPFFCNKFGLYISGIARPDDIHLEEKSVAKRSQGDFNYYEAIMVGATSNLAIAEGIYNGGDSILNYVDRILNNFSFATPGTTYEICPDYGMFVQAWNVGGINIPIIHQFFGVAPMASHKTVVLTPDMPSKWHEASLDDLIVGSNRISISFEANASTKRYHVRSAEHDWTFRFRVPAGATRIHLNGQPVDSRDIIFTGQDNVITFEK